MKAILIALAIFSMPAAFANESGVGNGGSAVRRGTETVLADYFYAARWEPLLIDEDLKDELLRIQAITEASGLSLGSTFWYNVFDPLVEYRFVKKLPAEIVMKIEELRGLDHVMVYGYTEYGEKGRVTWLNKEVFNSLSTVTEKALAIIHERFHATFGPQPYEYLTWYTSGIKKLREYDLGKIAYTKELHSFLHKYTYQAHGYLLQNRESRDKHAKFLLANGGKCVILASKISGNFGDGIRVKHRNDRDCVGPVTVNEINIDVDRGNKIDLHISEGGYDQFAITGIRVRGRGNQIVIENHYRGYGLESVDPNTPDEELLEKIGQYNAMIVLGNGNKIIAAGPNNGQSATKMFVKGDGNTIDKSALFVNINGNSNTVVGGYKHDHYYDDQNIVAIYGTNNTVINGDGSKIAGNNNYIDKARGEISGNANRLLIADHEKPTVIKGDGNTLENVHRFSLIGNENIVQIPARQYGWGAINGSRNKITNKSSISIEISGSENQLENLETHKPLTLQGNSNRIATSTFSSTTVNRYFGADEKYEPLVKGNSNTIIDSAVTQVLGSNLSVKNSNKPIIRE